jgi:CheY-like chemotaxis protein
MNQTLFSVLIVDDEPALLEVFTRMAERSGEIALQTSVSTAEALEVLQVRTFDAIIVDYDMPEIDGIRFLKILRSRGDTTPVIIYTGEGREHTAIEALNSGANFYLKKGEDARTQFGELVSMVKAAVGRNYLGRPLGTTRRIIDDMIRFIADPGFAIDSKGLVIAWNEPMEQLTGVPASAMVGKGDLAYAEPFFGKKRKMLVNLVFEPDEEIRRQKYMLVSRVPKGPVIAVTRGERRDGSTWTIWSKAMPIFDGQGNFVAVVALMRDVTSTFSDVVIREPAGDALPAVPEAVSKNRAGLLFNRIMGKATTQFREGVSLMRNGKKFLEAIAAFDRALAIDEKFAQAWNERGICYRELNDYTNALKSCLRAVELDPGNPEMLFTLGMTLEQIGVMHKNSRYIDSAIQVFRMVTDQLPDNLDAWNHLGICFKELGREEDAKYHFDRARDIRLWKSDTPIVSGRSGYL